VNGDPAHLSGQELRTPAAAAVAGILFALLYGTSYILILRAAPAFDADTGAWLSKGENTLRLAVSLLSFSGIAFLWFMGVVRDRLGHLEDQFFSTLFFGSGIIYVAMTFINAALAGAVFSLNATQLEQLVDSGMYATTRVVAHEISTAYGIRMAGMFMLVLGTIWLRTGVMPRWLVFLTYTLALVLLISIQFTQWTVMVFPAWVFLISVYILLLNTRLSRLQGNVSDGVSLHDENM
jgi:hypothetical protein